MKVTALIPDQIVMAVKKYSGGKTITESMLIALKEWLALKKILALNQEIQSRPLEFIDQFEAKEVRQMSRKP